MELPRRLDPAYLRAQTLGVDTELETPFGRRLLVYADFTASGRQLAFIEDYLRQTAALYANAHTEDSATGRAATHLLHEAEAAIKRNVGAGRRGKVVACGCGATAAIHKLQEILGLAVPPATLHFLTELARDGLGVGGYERAAAYVRERRPVVFVGPYEHHSNEVMWREGLCEVVEVDLTPDGQLDLGHLDTLLQDPAWASRPLIGSFSAASNVTGLVTPVRELARLLHRRGALALFDYAAAGPYVPIEMCPAHDPGGALDAVFLSPHKFLGGPGAAGLLIFDEQLYPHDLPPSVSGGGTVDYVGPDGHDFSADVETREKAGTPGFFQTLRAALALDVKRAVGIEGIQAREHDLVGRAFARWQAVPGVEILGCPEAERRIGIVSFNLADGRGGMLHPKLVATLLNDLFGIQARAGWSCAGPYGHRLLGIDEARGGRVRAAIRDGHHGLRPGWCRVGFHYTMDAAEADFLVEAVAFLAESGARFLPRYSFDVGSGTWTPRDAAPAPVPAFSLEAALAAQPSAPAPVPEAERRARYAAALDEARAWAERLGESDADARLDGDLADLQFFALTEGASAERADSGVRSCGGS